MPGFSAPSMRHERPTGRVSNDQTSRRWEAGIHRITCIAKRPSPRWWWASCRLTWWWWLVATRHQSLGIVQCIAGWGIAGWGIAGWLAGLPLMSLLMSLCDAFGKQQVRTVTIAIGPGRGTTRWQTVIRRINIIRIGRRIAITTGRTRRIRPPEQIGIGANKGLCRIRRRGGATR